MKKRPGLALDAAVVEGYSDDVQSYQIRNNNSLQFRAYLLNEFGMFTNDGRRLPGTVTKDNIDSTSLRKVGRGASGEVYFARLKDGTRVALKKISISSRTHRDEVDRELQFFSSANDCPFVMKNCGAFWDPEDGAIVIPMEWMAYSVKELSQFWDGLEETVLRDILYQVVSGLVYLHDVKRFIHRDIKPSNLLISETGTVKIADFGVSKLVQTLAVSSTYVGTMLFMAPERLDEGEYGFNSDVWSLGLTAITAVTGRNPWAPPEDINLFQVLGKIAGDAIPTLPTRPSYSKEAHDFVQQCLIRDPKLRPSSAELLKHPFFDGVTPDTAISNVKTAVDYMTRLINSDAKKTQQVKRSKEALDKQVHEKIDKLLA